MSQKNLPTAAELSHLRTAVDFALDALEPFEVADFLRDHRNGADLQPWLDAVEERQYPEAPAAKE